jgi:hypothetical protein
MTRRSGRKKGNMEVAGSAQREMQATAGAHCVLWLESDELALGNATFCIHTPALYKLRKQPIPECDEGSSHQLQAATLSYCRSSSAIYCTAATS